MNNSIGRRLLVALLLVSMLAGMMPAAFAAGEDFSNSAPAGQFVVSQTDYSIVPGVTESQLVMNNSAGDGQVKAYVTVIEPTAEVEFKASYSGYYTEGSTVESRAESISDLTFDMQSTTKQAAAFEAATGRSVVVATNADYYNMQSGQPCGYLIMEGNVFQTRGSSDEPYFAVLQDGSYVIRDYGVDHSDVVEAISGPFYLVKDGMNAGGMATEDTTKAPRNSIGLRADGSVILMLADGRQGVSNGMTLKAQADLLVNMGCVTAIYLDGGGSATIASKHAGSDTLTIQNTPSDGKERVVASTLLVVSTAEGSGTFDHASLSPNNEVYLAGSAVEFEAAGVDTAGFPTSIPTDVSWALADSSFGTMDATTGIFQSNGKCGTVTAQLIYGGAVVGETTIEITEPEELYFPADSINLAFKTSTDLDLQIRARNRDINPGTVVLDWKIESLTEGVEADGIGSMSGNIFTSVKAKQTLNCNVTVSFTKADGTVLTDTIAVEIGKMPQVLYDFEPDSTGHISRGVAQRDWGLGGRTYTSATNPLTFLAWDDAADAPAMVTKEGPFAFDSTYIDPNPAARDICYYPSASIFAADGYDFMTHHTGVMQVGSAAGDIVTAENGQVRFGDYALRWDYDYRVLNPGYKNVNMWLYSTETLELEGTPTGIGMWVYAPEATDNFWLWLYVGYYDKDTGAQKTKSFHFKTQEGRSVQYNGIYWDGWMYLEADISELAEHVDPEHPLHFAAGKYWLNLTFIPGGSANENGDKIPMGSFSNGSIYVDNVRAVYGDSVDDLEKPEFSAITANGTEVGNVVTEVTSNTVELAASFYDPESDTSTGIVAEKTALYVDGLKQTLTESSETGASASLTLANGTHSVKFVISDGFGNTNTVTRYIKVNAAESAYGSVTLAGETTATIGETYALKLEATGYETITEYAATVAINDTFGDPTVVFGQGYTGSYTLENGVMEISATASEPAAGTVATITYDVPADLTAADSLTYSIETGSFKQNDTTMTFAQPTVNVAPVAAYNLSADVMTAGGNGKIYVTKADGTNAGRVNVYAVVEGQEDVLVGATNSSGILVTNKFCQTPGESFTIYAKGVDGLSFRYTDITAERGSDEVLPTNIRLNAVSAPATTANISWFSAPQYTDAKAVVQYVDKAAYDSGSYTFASTTGSAATHAFTDDNVSAQICSVTLTGLQPGTAYVYRVGDGQADHWSDIRTFTTMVEDDDTIFYIIGDTQLSGNVNADAEALETLRQIAGKISAEAAEFGIQTGDFIDDAGNLGQWNETQGLFSEYYGNMPVVQVMGNHEYYGNTSGSHGEAFFALADEDFYSVEYGNVYIAVINCNASLEKAAAWLVEDAAKTDCEWKVMTVHQPVYYTNPKGSSAAYNQYLPAAIDAAGIDFVFSGHDHAYARTEPMTGGEIDTEGGTVYFVCGDLGEKSRSTEYAPDNNPDFHFAVINQEYDAVYLIAKTQGNDMTVTAYNVDGTVLDSYSMHHTTECEANGHTYTYNGTNVVCSVCGEIFDNYTGWITDAASGKDMYFLGGEYRTGWFTLDTDMYHFGEDGLAHNVSVVEDIPTSCDTRGHKTVECECGETQTLEYGSPTGHVYQQITADDGTVSYVCDKCGLVSPLAIPFIDVEMDKWYTDAIEYCYEMDYIRGVTTITFGPEIEITREQLATILWRIESAPAPTGAYPFSDTCGNYSRSAITWAAENGIVKGYTDGTFKATNKMTRQELVTMIYRFAEYKGMDVSNTTDLAEAFTDADSISKYAKTPTAWAVAAGIIKGVKVGDGYEFQPNATATRAQVAVIIQRLMQGE